MRWNLLEGLEELVPEEREVGDAGFGMAIMTEICAWRCVGLVWCSRPRPRWR